jgi:hypothetical protein
VLNGSHKKSPDIGGFLFSALRSRVTRNQEQVIPRPFFTADKWHYSGDKGSAWWETGSIASSNNDVISPRTNLLDPVFSPFLAYVPVSGIATFAQTVGQVKTARLPNFYCFLGVSIHDCRDSQPGSRWLRKVGVPDFLQISPISSWLKFWLQADRLK